MGFLRVYHRTVSLSSRAFLPYRDSLAYILDDEREPARFDPEFVGREYSIPGTHAGNSRMVSSLLPQMADGRAPHLPTAAVDASDCYSLFTAQETTGRAMSPLPAKAICHSCQNTTRVLYPVYDLTGNIIRLRNRE